MIIKVKSPSVVLKTKDKYLTEDIQIEVDESVVNGEYSTLKNVLDATKSCYYLFYQYQGESVEGLISYSDTKNVTNMSYMFRNCSNLQTIPLLDTSNVTNMSSMFQSCGNLQTIPLLDTSNVTNMSSMFHYCASLQTIPLLDTSLVNNMGEMFYSCGNLQTIPLLDTSNVTNMSSMFQSCSSLQTIPQLDARNVTSTNYIFQSCNSLQTILMYGMKVRFDISPCRLLNAEALVTILSNCQVITTTQTITMGSILLAKLDGVYVKETGVELYEGITCRPCVICASSDEGAMLATDYITGKGWTLA